MKFSKTYIFILFGLVLSIAACKEDNSAAKDAARNSLNVPEEVAPVTPAIQSSEGAVAHYICPNNCEGSGGAAQGNCPVCGTAYVHNQAFHSQPAAGGNTTPTTTPPPSAQNAAGVYHYICSNGCEGGAATQGTCASCGSALVHNTAFHN